MSTFSQDILKKESLNYNQLSVTQWVAGFGHIMGEEQNSEIKDSMLDYLISLFDDANEFSWDAAKASHAVLLCRMEQGEIKSYTEVEKIDRVRRANTQRHSYPTANVQNSKKIPQKSGKTMPCIFYNQGTCNQPRTHETKGIVYRIFVLRALPMENLCLCTWLSNVPFLCWNCRES